MPRIPEAGSVSASDIELAASDAKSVHLSVCVKRVFAVDTIEQTYGIQVMLTMVWPCPRAQLNGENGLDAPPSPDEDDGDWEPEWSPKYSIKNVVEEIDEEVQYSTTKDSRGNVWILMESEEVVKVYEKLELGDFPTDCQVIVLYHLVSVLRMIATTRNGNAGLFDLERNFGFNRSWVSVLRPRWTRTTLFLFPSLAPMVSSSRMFR